MLAHFETLSTTATISQLELLTRRRRVTPRAPRTYHPHMSNGDLHWIANYIWGIADDVLRDLYVRGKYRGGAICCLRELKAQLRARTRRVHLRPRNKRYLGFSPAARSIP